MMKKLIITTIKMHKMTSNMYPRCVFTLYLFFEGNGVCDLLRRVWSAAVKSKNKLEFARANACYTVVVHDLSK